MIELGFLEYVEQQRRSNQKKLFGDGLSRNLLARDESYVAFLHQTVLPAHQTLHEQGLKGFHELRAAYACERYKQLTGHAASVNGGHCHSIDRDLDQQAWQQISFELGHNRIDVVSAYIGGRA